MFHVEHRRKRATQRLHVGTDSRRQDIDRYREFTDVRIFKVASGNGRSPQARGAVKARSGTENLGTSLIPPPRVSLPVPSAGVASTRPQTPAERRDQTGDRRLLSCTSIILQLLFGLSRSPSSRNYAEWTIVPLVNLY